MTVYNDWMKRLALLLVVLVLGFSYFVFSRLIFQTQKITPSYTSNSSPLRNITPILDQTAEFSDWTAIGRGMDVRTFSYNVNSSNWQLHVVRLDPNQVNFSVKYQQTGQSISSWMNELSEQGGVINGGFFKEANQPVGRLYIDGQRLDNHQIPLEQSGMVVFDEQQVKIIDLRRESLPSDYGNTSAVQSYPMLVSNGIGINSLNDTMVDRRTAIGTDSRGMVYIIIANSPNLTLARFTSELLNLPLSLTKVLNLDGGSSTGLGIKSPDINLLISSQTLLPGVILFEAR